MGVMKIYKGILLNSVLLFLYAVLAVATLLYDIIMVYLGGFSVTGVFIAVLTVTALVVLCPVCIRKLEKIYIASDQGDPNRIFLSVVFGVLTFLVLLFWYLGYSPGFFFSDMKDQLDQAVSGKYSDWHPVIQTFMTFTIPLKITGEWVGSIILLQILFFSAVIGYMSYVIMNYTSWKIALGAVLLIILNPITGKMCLYPLKDTSLAIWGLLALCFAVQIYVTNGRWVYKTSHLIAFSIVIAIVTLVRHNGIFFTLPLLIGCLFFISEKKKKLYMIGTIILLIFLVKVPFYHILDVEAPGQRQTEMLGLPLTIIGNVVKEHPESLDEETQKFVYELAPAENWQTYYDRGSFNSIKWREGTDLSVIEKTGIFPVLRMTLKSIKSEPASSVEALIAITKIVYSMDESSHFYHLGVGPEDYEVAYTGNPALRTWGERYEKFIYESPLQYVFCYVGIQNLILVVFILGKIRFSEKGVWKKLFLCVPALAYDFGTMLMLSGRDDRLFYVTFTSLPIVVLMLLLKVSDQR